MAEPFRIGLTPDFATQVKGLYEGLLEEAFRGLPDLEIVPMPPQADNVATAEALRDLDAVMALGLRFTADSLRDSKRLAIVARWGVGYDMIDVPAATEAGIALCITPNGVRKPVAEAQLTMMFALAKNLFRLDRSTRAGQWRKGLTLSTDFDGKVLGSIGCGNIGQELFRMSRSLGFARAIACDPFVAQEQVSELGVELVDFDTVFRESDFVVVNTLLNASTVNLVDEKSFRLMKPSAYFINLARGPIVHHESLVRALRENWIAGAGIDVFPEEPPPANDPLFELDNAIVTPHALAWTEGIMRNNGLESCEHVLQVKRGETPTGLVNREVAGRPEFLRKLERYK